MQRTKLLRRAAQLGRDRLRRVLRAVRPQAVAALARMLDDRAAKVRAELDEAARLRARPRRCCATPRSAAPRRWPRRKALIEGAKAEAGGSPRPRPPRPRHRRKRREQMAMDRIAAAEKAAVDEVRLAAAEVATVAAARR